jgi:hypothetical protein
MFEARNKNLKDKEIWMHRFGRFVLNEVVVHVIFCSLFEISCHFIFVYKLVQRFASWKWMQTNASYFKETSHKFLIASSWKWPSSFLGMFLNLIIYNLKC